MNWELFDKLRTRIATLEPSQFDYDIPWLEGDGCGCVAAHCSALVGNQTARGTRAEADLLGRELKILPEESFFLYGYATDYEPAVLHLAGAAGIREALRRLDIVASHYNRPSTFVPSETAFLASVRALPLQELVEV